MAASPAPSLDSIRGIEMTFIEHNGYLSDSPLTLSGSSPPVSDSAICDDYPPNSMVVDGVNSSAVNDGKAAAVTGGGSGVTDHLPISSSVSSSASSSSSSSSSSSTSSSSGLSGCGSTSSNSSNGVGSSSNSNSVVGPGIIGSGKGSPCNSILPNLNHSIVNNTDNSNSDNQLTTGNNIISIGNSNNNNNFNNTTTNNNLNNFMVNGSIGGAWSRCTACKSKQSDAVAKCYDCLSFLCGSCVTAHEFMHCFNGHNIYLFNNFEPTLNRMSSSASSSTIVNSITANSGNTVNHSLSVLSTSGGGGSNNGDNTSITDYKLSNSFNIILQQQQNKEQKNLEKQQQQQSNYVQQQHHQQQPQQPITHLSKIVAAAAAAASSYASHQNSFIGNELNQSNTIDDLFSSVVPLSLRTQLLINEKNQHNHYQQTLQNQTATTATATFYCQRHKNEILKFTCRTCCTLVCKDCISEEHNIDNLHEIESIQENSLGTILTRSTAATPPTAITNSSETVLQSILADLRGKAGEIVALVDGNQKTNATSTLCINNNDIDLHQVATKFKLQYQRTSTDINETYQFFCSILEERKQELLKELENLYASKLNAYTMCVQRSKELVEKTLQTCDTIERSPKSHNIADVLMLRKNLELQLQTAIQELQLPFELQFMSNYQSIQAGIRNTFGYLRVSSVELPCGGLLLPKQPPIARPTQSSLTSITSTSHLGGGGEGSSSNSSVTGGSHLPAGLGLPATLLENSFTNTNALATNGLGGGGLLLSRNSEPNFDDLLSKGFASPSDSSVVVATNGNVSSVANAAVALMNTHITNPYEKWSNGGNDVFTSNTDPFSSTTQILNSVGLTNGNSNICNASAPNNGGTIVSAVSNAFSTLNLNATNLNGGIGGGTVSTSGLLMDSVDTLRDVTSKLMTASIYPPKSQIKRQKMIYHCKFGEFGVMEGQFTEPSGVAVNAQNDIIVADTNNHRIQIFDKEGRFKFQFGECGKRDSQLLYPNRVAVVRGTGDIIVTERSPTHQVQIYNQYGQFVRKFGADKLQHPRGVTVDNKGRIIVIECKVMRVVIFDQKGNMLHTFSCSQHLEFPNGVVVNDKQEIFISDNRSHCVKVFNYEGRYLRQIGGEGITNYPIGVGMNNNGEILIADNHNNFNLTIFTQDGQLVSALESKVKHAQCFDVALMDDGSVVLANKDYRLYIYRYVQVPPIGL